MAQSMRAEMIEVRGCTEPAAIAYAALLARRSIRTKFAVGRARISLQLSPGVFRNASTAVVPALRRRGIVAAVLTGLYSRARGFDPFSSLSPARFSSNLEQNDWVDIRRVRKPGLFIHLELRVGAHTSGVTIAHRHDGVLSMKRDGRLLRLRPPAHFCRLKDMATVEAVVNRHSPGLEKLALQFIKYHAALDSRNLTQPRVLRERIRDRMLGRLGAVMTITGSGNQGLFLGIPMSRLYAVNGRQALPSILFAMLTQIYLSQGKGRISDTCGLANKAGPALAAGLAHSRGCDLSAIKAIMRRVSLELRNMRCDGATPKCGTKAQQVLSKVQEALESFETPRAN